MKGPSASFLVLALALVLSSEACRERDILTASNQTPIILISVDTLRSDHLPIYGYDGIATPAIEGLARDAIVFERVYSHSPLTLPSHATMLTGLYPARTGLRDNAGFRLDPDVQTLGELLKANGYATGAAISAYVLRSETGISRGFDFFDDQMQLDARAQSMGRVQRDGARTIEVASRWIREHRSAPFFFFLHLYEPHSPYDPPEPYRARHSNPYDAEIAYADELVGRFIEMLKQEGLYDPALIIFTSDHGEGLGDHLEDEHGIFLYRESIQVPLVVKLPGSGTAGKRIGQAVQLADLFPTIAEQAASPYNEKGIIGRSLRPLMAGQSNYSARVIYSESLYPRLHFGWSELHSVIEGDSHFIHAPAAELYDLAADPREHRNILSEQRRLATRLRQEAERRIAAPSAPVPIDAEEARKLAALGYVGGAAPTARSNLPDPKSRITEIADLKKGLRLFHDRDYSRAVAVLEALLARNPLLLDAWETRARALIRLQRHEEAFAAAREALKLSPHTTHLALMVANAALESRRYKDAEDHARIVEKTHPAEAHELLARIALAQGDFSRARLEAQRALASGREPVSALMTLGRIEKEAGNLDEALAHYDSAARTLHQHGDALAVSLNFQRGDILARLGRFEEAEKALRQEIRDFPSEPPAYKNLIILYAAQARVDDATKMVFALEKASPNPDGYLAIVEALHAIGDSRGGRFWARRGLARFPDDARLRLAAA